MGNNQRGGGDRQQQQHQQMQPNEAMSASAKLAEVLRTLEARGDELRGILPRDVRLDGFLANVNQAFRNNPKLLNCTFDSIIDACVKAAYDGLRIDGKEAAIVDATENYKVGNAWRERRVARYMPMAQGLIKQILQCGAALTVKAVIAYSAEARAGRFRVVEGTNPHIHHEPFIEGEEKGAMIGAYAIAEVQRGVFKFEWMDAAAILDVKKESKTDKVWTRWPTEMWKKTVIRRLRKSLSGTSQIRDAEAMTLFPQFDRTQPHPQMIGHNQQSSMPARPTRESIADHSGTENGTSMDFARGHDDDGVLVEQQRDDRHEQQQGQRRENPSEQDREQDRVPDVQLPEDDAAWAIWAADLEKKIADAATADVLDKAWNDASPVFKAASKPIRDRLLGVVSDRNADLAIGD